MLSLSLNSMLSLGLFLSASIFFSFVYFRLRRGAEQPRLRPLPGIGSLRELAERSLEEGRAMHLAMGTGRVSEQSAPEMLMSIIVLDRMVEESVQTNQIPIVTTGDPASQLLAAGSLARGDRERALRTRTFTRFIAPRPEAYAAGTRGAMQREKLGLTAAVGHLRNEYLFLAAEQPSGGKELNAPEMAATAQIETLPLVYLTARNPILGEEIFSLGAYLARWPAHLASVILQDAGRLLVVAVILVGVLLQALGVV